MNYGYQPQYTYNPYYSQYGYQGMQQLQNQQQLNQQVPQQQIQSQPPQQNLIQNTLQGWYVDSFDVTKSINADMSGTAMFFPSTDGKEIYKKQLDINTGKSSTLIYKLENTIEQNNNIDYLQITKNINDTKKDLLDKISEIREIVLDCVTSPKNGGDK